jgi:hypothetical protein
MEAMIHLFTTLLLTIAHLPGNADLERESLPAEGRIVAPSPDPRAPRLPGAPGGVVNVESRFGKDWSKADPGF